ncbi:MAG: hypothetical protein ABIE70_13045 [bacterium]
MVRTHLKKLTVAGSNLDGLVSSGDSPDGYGVGTQASRESHDATS